MCITFLFRTDVHAADRNPESWKADYPAEIWSSLEQIGQLARRHKASAVLDGGDFFHVKASTRNSHRLVSRVAEIHAEYPCPTYMVIGNHDIAHNNLETLSRQPLQVLFASKVFHQLHPVEAVFTEKAKPPHEKDVKVRVVGFPYNSARTLEELRSVKKQDEDYLIAVVHALAAEKPPAHVEEFFGEEIFRYADLVYEGGPDVWAFGHWHKDQGVVEIDGRYFVNPGAVSRGALVKENLKRVPQVALISVEDGGSAGYKLVVGTIPLKLAPAKEVFDLERKERRERENEVLNQFVERIHESVVSQIGTGDNEAEVDQVIEQLDFAPKVRERAQGYLERARTKE